MKTVFLIVSKDIVRRNILDTDFWPAFVERVGKTTRIVLIVDAGKEDYFKEKYKAPDVVVEGYEREAHRGLKKFLYFLSRTGIRSKSNTFHRWYAHARGRAGLVTTLFKSVISNTLARTTWYKQLIRALLLKSGRSETICRLYEAYTPDTVFAFSLTDNDVDVPFSLEARRRGIRVVGMVRSWDNLNHHGLLCFVPDHFIFQNEWLKYAASHFQRVKTHSIQSHGVGLPHYDKYFDPSALLADKAVFKKSVGLNPQKRYLFLGGSEYYHSEDSLIRVLNEMIDDGRLPSDLEIFYRIHPSSMYSIEDLGVSDLEHVVLDNAFLDKDAPKFTDTEKFVNMLYHADVTISIGSSLSIDASAFDRPAIAIEYDDPKKGLPFWLSVHRFNDYFDHQAHMIATGGVRTPRDEDELARDINAYLESDATDREGRKKIIEEFVAPFDGKAGERLAEILSAEV